MFAHDMRTTSSVSVAATTLSDSQRRDLSEQPSDASIPLDEKETKSTGWRRKEQKKSRRSTQEKDLSTRRLEVGDAKGEGDRKVIDGKRREAPKGNRKEKHRSDQESIKASTTISRTPKEHSSSNGMAPTALTVKSVGVRVQSIQETVSEPVVVSASPTPTLATTRSEPTPLITSVGRVRSRVARVEKGV